VDGVQPAKDGLGGFYVVGMGNGVLDRYDDNGTLVWRKTFPGRITGPAIDSGGNLYLGFAGIPEGGTNSASYILRVDSFGNQIWAIQTRLHQYYLKWQDGYVYSTSYAPYYDTANTYKISSSGVVKWQAELPSVGWYAGPYALELDSVGDLFVSGLLGAAAQDGGFVYQVSNP
jgi:hypothetical protein